MFLEEVWRYIVDNWEWLIPVIIIPLGNEIVKLTPTEKDNDIWKAFTAWYQAIFGVKNLDKDGNEIPIYSKDELKPETVRNIENIIYNTKKRLRFSKNGKFKQ